MIGDRRALAALLRCLRGQPADPVDWSAVFRIANDHLLTPALYRALADAHRLSRLPRDAVTYLETLHGLNAERNRALRQQAIELVGELNRRGVTPALLKGGLALFDGPYAEPAQRMMRDLDILVPSEARDTAVAVLHELGYGLSRQYPAEHHAMGDFSRPNDPGSVDLHTELVDPSYVLPAAEVRARATPLAIDGVRFLVPSPTDRVMHNVLHAQIHFLGHYYRGELQVQQAHELAALSRHFGSAIDWGFIEGRFGVHRLTTALQSHLLAAHRLFGLSWPLAHPPGAGARVHYRRCVLQLHVPPLRWVAIPWGNLRGAFAWHRMHALHGDAGGPMQWRCRHLLRYLRKKGVGAVVGRMMRTA